MKQLHFFLKSKKDLWYVSASTFNGELYYSFGFSELKSAREFLYRELAYCNLPYFFNIK
jgi:hypothetical protein